MAVLKKYSFICYPESCDIQEAFLYFKDNIISYAYILHDRDFIEGTTDLKKPHYHIYIEFDKAVSSVTLKNRFSCSTYESVKNVNGVIQYMTHKRYPQKAQYESDEIMRFNIDVDEIVNKIAYGENTELDALIQIFCFIKTENPTPRELIEWAINKNYYSILRANYSLIKDYKKDSF